MFLSRDASSLKKFLRKDFFFHFKLKSLIFLELSRISKLFQKKSPSEVTHLQQVCVILRLLERSEEIVSGF